MAINSMGVSDNKSDVMWCVYSMYTHELVEITSDIKGFCASANLGKSAYIQIYKTHQICPKKKRPYLPTYKGFFIRRHGNDSISFPDKVLRKPEFLNIYTYPGCELIEKIPFSTLKEWLISKGCSVYGTTPMYATYKRNQRSSLLSFIIRICLLAQYMVIFLTTSENIMILKSHFHQSLDLTSFVVQNIGLFLMILWI
ncbi:hypothetical protein [Photobacterium kishitanii]|uniref:hypothetical protein n=1 Tax=Photobacterium kishitanii TaxID=318456 RepID=UPI0027397B29|nr:hypothetical protein [Photobacterium kishitanii]